MESFILLNEIGEFQTVGTSLGHGGQKTYVNSHRNINAATVFNPYSYSDAVKSCKDLKNYIQVPAYETRVVTIGQK